MGLTLMTAMEIVSHPSDLQVQLAQSSEGKFAVCISRGPGHRFKLLLSCEHVIASRADAVQAVRQIFESSLQAASTAAAILDEPACESQFLTQARIDELIARLATSDCVKTFD